MKPSPEMLAALCLARRAHGAFDYNGGWFVGGTKVDGKAVHRLIQSGLVEETRWSDYGSATRVELNLRGQDIADEAMSRAAGAP